MPGMTSVLDVSNPVLAQLAVLRMTATGVAAGGR
jgi:hypothetical protein